MLVKGAKWIWASATILFIFFSWDILVSAPVRLTYWGRDKLLPLHRHLQMHLNVWISLKISLKFVAKSQINNILALIQIMAWRRPGDNPLSETMMDSLLTHICITWPQWVNKSYNTSQCHIPYYPYEMHYEIKTLRRDASTGILSGGLSNGLW